MNPAWFLLFAATALAQTTGADQTGSVTGVVTDAISHMPLKKATVTVNSVQGVGGMGRHQGAAAATTDAAGAFTITNLQAGSYRLMVQHPNYPQARFGAMVKSVDVKAGEAAGPVTAELIPGATVTGHITDEDGDPIPNCNVLLRPAKHPDQGVPMLGATGSNEDGEYRIYGVVPGKYILQARCGRPAFQARPFSGGPELPPTHAYPPQYYPLTSEANAAQAVELTPGAEKSGIDFRMRPAPVTQVRGAFSPVGADWHGSNLFMQMVPIDQKVIGGMNPAAPVDQAKVTFEFRQVFAGSYMLFAFSNGSEESRTGVTQRIDVSDQPINLVLELRRAVELSGKVEIESTGNTTNPVTLSQIGIGLAPEYQVGLPPSQTQVNDDGSFTLKGVIPGLWRPMVNAQDAFMKSAWLGNMDITDSFMDLTAGAAASLRIVVSTNTATLRGSAPAGQTVFVEHVEANFSRSTRGVGVDQSSQFKLEHLPPGKYRVVLADSGSPMPEEGGQEVTVHEGETVMLDLKPPPA